MEVLAGQCGAMHASDRARHASRGTSGLVTPRCFLRILSTSPAPWRATRLRLPSAMRTSAETPPTTAGMIGTALIAAAGAVVLLVCACASDETLVYVVGDQELAGAELFVDDEPSGKLMPTEGGGCHATVRVTQGATRRLEVRHPSHPVGHTSLHYSVGTSEAYLVLGVNDDGMVSGPGIWSSGSPK